MSATVVSRPARALRALPFPGRVRNALLEGRDPNSRWPFLDGARGVAIIAVVGFHALRIVGGWYAPKIQAQGVPAELWVSGLARFAIDVFFVLSGFLIATTWWARRKRFEKLRPALADYWRGRVFRVLPVFWLSALVWIPLRAPELLTSLKDLVLVATVQQYLDPSLPEKFNVVTWSLTTEMHFYLLLPILAVLVQRRFGGVLTLTGAVLLSVLWFVVRNGAPSSLILGRLDQFVAGMVVADIYRRHVEGQLSVAVRFVTARGMGWLLGTLLVLVGVYHGVWLGLPHGHWFDAWQHPIAGILIAGLGLRLLCLPTPRALQRFLERPNLLLLGAMSYSLYLWHLPIFEGVFHFFDPMRGGVPVLGTALILVIALALSLAVSVFSYTYVELAFMQRKRRKRMKTEESEQRSARELEVGATPSAPSPAAAGARTAAGR